MHAVPPHDTLGEGEGGGVREGVREAAGEALPRPVPLGAAPLGLPKGVAVLVPVTDHVAVFQGVGVALPLPPPLLLTLGVGASPLAVGASTVSVGLALSAAEEVPMALAEEVFAPLPEVQPLLDRDAPTDLVPRALLLPPPPPDDAEGVPACLSEEETEADGEMEGRGGALRLTDGDALGGAVGLPKETLGRRETVPLSPLPVACTEAVGVGVSDTCPLGDLEALDEAETEALRVEEAVRH